MIVIPMAGESRRFRAAGYTRPKYQLPLGSGYVFDYAVRGFRERFGVEALLFIMAGADRARDFVLSRLRVLGVPDAALVVLAGRTAGQAQTVDLGLLEAGVGPEESITIFNIDTFRPGFHMTEPERSADGYLEVFRGDGAGWSFIVPRERGGVGVARVVEKCRVSDLCCTGLYYFRRRADFSSGYELEQAAPSQVLGERYVAPIYNQLIAGGKQVVFREVPRSAVICCGVPEEYEDLRARPELLDGFA